MHEPRLNPASAAPESATLLCVDDEGNILSALKRLFRPHGYHVLTAESGPEGLAVLEREAVDLVISDMRMPGMNGAQFLQQVRSRWPGSVRILLTGYADIGSTIDAINKGEIYRYITKPWEDSDLLLGVRHALERSRLEREKARLEALTREQNEALKALNASLEEKVRARTEEVRQTMTFLEQAHEQLKRGFMASIHTFSSLIEMRGGALAGHSRRVAEHARGLAVRLGLPEGEVQDVLFAALLHDIGKLGLPDSLMGKPLSVLSLEERAEVMKHPLKGQALLMGLEQLHNAALFIRSHHEQFDGKGYPDGLSGMQIPMGARILAVANEYDGLQYGGMLTRPMKATEALEYIRECSGTRYDPQVVAAFVEMIQSGGLREITELPLKSTQLKGGMALSRDLLTEEGILLLSRGHVLTEKLIAQLHSYERTENRRLTVHILKG